MQLTLFRILSTDEKNALAIIKANPNILGRELDAALRVSQRARYHIIEGLRDNLFPIIGEKSVLGGFGYRIAKDNKEWEQYALRELRECHKRLNRTQAITKAALWREY